MKTYLARCKALRTGPTLSKRSINSSHYYNASIPIGVFFEDAGKKDIPTDGHHIISLQEIKMQDNRRKSKIEHGPSKTFYVT